MAISRRFILNESTTIILLSLSLSLSHTHVRRSPIHISPLFLFEASSFCIIGILFTIPRSSTAAEKKERCNLRVPTTHANVLEPPVTARTYEYVHDVTAVPSAQEKGQKLLSVAATRTTVCTAGTYLYEYVYLNRTLETYPSLCLVLTIAMLI